jgi:hypothetical protein
MSQGACARVKCLGQAQHFTTARTRYTRKGEASSPQTERKNVSRETFSLSIRVKTRTIPPDTAPFDLGRRLLPVGGHPTTSDSLIEPVPHQEWLPRAPSVHGASRHRLSDETALPATAARDRPARQRE